MSSITEEKPIKSKYGSGSVWYDKKAKTWRGMVHHTSNGEPIRKGARGDTEQEVREKLKEIKARLTLQSEMDKKIMEQKLMFSNTCLNGDALLRDVLIDMMQVIKGTVEDSTYKQYVYFAEIIIHSPISLFVVNEIMSRNVQMFLNSLAQPSQGDTPASERVLLGCKHFIHRVFKYALSNRIILADPMLEIRSVIIPKTKNKGWNTQPLSTDTISKLISLVEDSPVYKAIINTLLLTGMRIGELIALSWNNVDFENKVIHICQAAIKEEYMKADGTIGYTTAIGSTKTEASLRDLPISPELEDILSEWRMLQTSRRNKPKYNEGNRYVPSGKSIKEACRMRKMSADKTGHNLVFPNQGGNLRSNEGLAKQFRDRLKNGNLTSERIHFHALRHTFASYLAKQGVQPKVLQHLLGHTDLRTTLTYYIDTDLDSLFEAVETMGTIVKGLKCQDSEDEQRFTFAARKRF